MDHPLAPLLHKSKFYSFENEVRLVAYDPEANLMEERDIHDNGTLIDVDLSRLISEVRVAKDAPNWFFELVSTLVKDKYELDVDVKKSKMNQEPIFGISTLE
ncbi:hypothetical protein GCM10009123_04590 [Kangiella japonica]|uniref:DUF2283 domain-containing protein n=1 Tax=Kangiella japonica TaxID=647384 RepID=A0ABN0SUE6_9GAMM